MDMPKRGDFFAFDRELADAVQARESSQDQAQAQDQEARRVRALREALLAGLQSGTPRPFDFEAFKARKRASYASAS
ncbi:type II toxin-antitoxin system ParD family antitoxin [Allofranklinella schreckenbergeri]|uniref:Type II toxin-antitoxin system ParD family antitoxin n=1 Tax=Allofranklinella schreckenbergeri TaxID=1076744 RepID=A0A3M6QT59_9BURK|nr:type II toxin-antitoxin system ParD family antitoxin [Allofranklinella schreckenbergeri]